VLGHEPIHADSDLVEWEDWDIGRTVAEHPVSQGVHVGFRAPDHAAVDAFWRNGVDAGYATDGALLPDPDGNSVEAVHRGCEHRPPDGCIDHLWVRVSDLAASRRFYLTIAPHAGLRLTGEEPGRVQLSGADYDLSLVRDDRPVTQHVHLAFPAAA
jgi:hypothetical protein